MDGAGLMQNGVAEFVAQEEMDRTTGYWWSPDEWRIAFTRIDDSARARGRALRDQRGRRADVATALSVRGHAQHAGRAEGHRARAAAHDERRAALARRLSRARDLVSGLDAASPCSGRAAIRRRSTCSRWMRRRGQSRIAADGAAPHWVELHDDLHFLDSRPAFIWSSRRSGYKHLYLYDLEGKLIRPLTAGEWMVVGDGVENGIVGVDENRAAWCISWRTRHRRSSGICTSTSLDTARPPSAPKRISREADGTTRACCPARKAYLDLCSSPEQPPTASVRKLDGTVQHWLVRNALDASHPYHDVPLDSRQGGIRLDRARATARSSTIACSSRRTAARQALSGHRRHLWRAALPIRAQGLDGRLARRARLFPASARTARLRRVHARQSRLGIPRRGIRIRDREAGWARSRSRISCAASNS